MNAIIWNCRGLGNTCVGRIIKELCRSYNLDVLCLLQMRSNSSCVTSLPRSLPFTDSCRIPFEGFSGGIWLFWPDNNCLNSILKENK